MGDCALGMCWCECYLGIFLSFDVSVPLCGILWVEVVHRSAHPDLATTYLIRDPVKLI